MMNKESLYILWNQLYPDNTINLLNNFFEGMENQKVVIEDSINKPFWYKDAVVYSLYIDLFNEDIPGLVEKLDYLKELGVSCLWLLPMLQSPMRDAGFDISDYYSIRNDLLDPNDEGLTGFRQLLREAHDRNIRVIFDVAMNHTSDQHPWFLEAKKSTDNAYRNYYIWSKEPSPYSSARIIFKGIENSNWEKCGEEYFFHRFFNFQPDLNYRNPEVLLEMCRVLLFWQQQGVDGFRADAVPYIWKKENTDCENLPETHLVVKFFRAILDYVKPGTLLLAEACQPPVKVVEYLGQGDECHAAYHFPLMPRIFMALAKQSGAVIQETLSPSFTPSIPESAQWFTFLRCHDELSLERVYVTEEERAFIHNNYCHQPLWDFRQGEGISARLSELLKRNPDRILLAYSIMLTLPGTPVIYYGDETAKVNDIEYYQDMIRLTGKDDTRFLVRGKIDWHLQEKTMNDPVTSAHKVYNGLKTMLNIRKNYKVFGRGSIEFIDIQDHKTDSLFSYIRKHLDQEILVIHNLSDVEVEFKIPDQYLNGPDLISGLSTKTLKPYKYQWRLIK
ncbi:MAG: alpha-amylase family glycosyl hydrolase [Bacteroidales bacterium]